MSHAFFDALSVLRPSDQALSREARSQIQVHRLLSLLGAALVPLFGPLYALSNPGAVDPAWARLGIAALFAGLFMASYAVGRIRRHYVRWMRGVLYVLMIWFVVLTTMNQFVGNYALGLLLVFSVLGVVVGLGVDTAGPALRFLGFGLLLTVGGSLLGPEPRVSLPILLLSMATVAVVGSVVIQAQIAIREELREAKEEAQEASRLKTAMLANMSHEIRTPLTSIHGFAEVLTNELEGRMRALAEKIYQSGQRLLETLRAVLELSRLEAGTFELERRRVDVAAKAKEVAERLRPEAEEKEVALRTDLPEGPVWARGNEAAIARIGQNLIGNAIKFTPEGGKVQVRARRQGREAVLEVSDTGIGIEEEAVPKVFEAFRQESEGLGREYEGTGLGLPIVKELTEALGGTIEVETEKGEGSRFTVRLPLSEEAGEE